MSELRIGEVARKSGIATSAIRYYEREGLIPRALRHNGQRVYDASILRRLQLIEIAKSAGFTVAEMRRLLAGFGGRKPPSARWRSLLDAKRVELDARIEEAQRMKVVLDQVASCRCPSIDDCVSGFPAIPGDVG